MNVLEVILDNRLGGISQRALTVAAPLSEKGVTTHFFLPLEEGNVAELAQSQGIPVWQHYMPRPNPRKPLRSLLWALFIPINTLQLCRLVRQQSIDAIHVNGLINLPGFFASKLCGVPLIWHLAGTTVYPKPLVRVFRPFLRRATVLVCIAEKVRDYFLGESRAAFNYRIIYEPVNLEAFSVPTGVSESETVRDSLGIPQDAFLITTVANLSPIKGIEYAIEAVGSLSDEKRPIHYLVVGEKLTSQRAYFEKLEKTVERCGLSQNVCFPGKRSDISRILGATDVFLLPSLSEGTPISILEAMALRVPVVASNIGGIPEQIEAGVGGLLVEAGNPEAIADALRHLLHTPEDASRFAESAFGLVHARFSLARFTSDFSALIYEIVGKAQK